MPPPSHYRCLCPECRGVDRWVSTPRPDPPGLHTEIECAGCGQVVDREATDGDWRTWPKFDIETGAPHVCAPVQPPVALVRPAPKRVRQEFIP